MSGNASPDVHGAGNTETTALATVGCIPSDCTAKGLRPFFYDTIEAGVFQAHSFGSKIATVLLHPLSSCTTAVPILDAMYPHSRHFFYLECAHFFNFVFLLGGMHLGCKGPVTYYVHTALPARDSSTWLQSAARPGTVVPQGNHRTTDCAVTRDKAEPMYSLFVITT